MLRFDRLAAGGVAMIAFAFALAFINGPVSAQEPTWDYKPARVRSAITQELTDALCPPYSTLVFFEDRSYNCVEA